MPRDSAIFFLFSYMLGLTLRELVCFKHLQLSSIMHMQAYIIHLTESLETLTVYLNLVTEFNLAQGIYSGTVFTVLHPAISVHP